MYKSWKYTSSLFILQVACWALLYAVTNRAFQEAIFVSGVTFLSLMVIRDEKHRSVVITAALIALFAAFATETAWTIMNPASATWFTVKLFLLGLAMLVCLMVAAIIILFEVDDEIEEGASDRWGMLVSARIPGIGIIVCGPILFYRWWQQRKISTP